VSSALQAAARASGEAPTIADVRERSRWVSRLLKLEFMYRVGATHDEVFAETIELLERIDGIGRTADRVTLGADPSVVPFLAALLRPYLEAYRLTFEALQALDRADPNAGFDRRAIVKAALEHGRAAYASGRIAMREAISKVTFENAAEWLFQQGALAPGEAGRSRLAASWREKKLPEFLQELQVTLGA
jgi:glycerol-3-phosphate O-acyltransferase